MRYLPWATGLAATTLCACTSLAGIAPPPADTTRASGPGQPRYRLTALPLVSNLTADADSQLATAPAGAAIDGNNATAWSNGGYRNPTAWLRLKFTADLPLEAVLIRAMPPAAAGTSYDLQVSPDGTAWTTALANQTNTSWNVETKLLPAGTHGKALRVFWRNSQAAPQPHVAIYELSVRGGSASPGSTPPSTAPSTTPTPDGHADDPSERQPDADGHRHPAGPRGQLPAAAGPRSGRGRRPHAERRQARRGHRGLDREGGRRLLTQPDDRRPGRVPHHRPACGHVLRLLLQPDRPQQDRLLARHGRSPSTARAARASPPSTCS